MVLISACLVGVKCRYDGNASPQEQLRAMVSDERFIPVCPEQLGGLPTPRPPAEILHGDGLDVLKKRAVLINSDSRDVTEWFLRGARETLYIAELLQVSTAILKEKSPSCGVHSIKRKGLTVPGVGVTAALLAEHGIRVISSENVWEDYVRYRRDRK